MFIILQERIKVRHQRDQITVCISKKNNLVKSVIDGVFSNKRPDLDSLSFFEDRQTVLNFYFESYLKEAEFRLAELYKTKGFTKEWLEIFSNLIIFNVDYSDVDTINEYPFITAGEQLKDIIVSNVPISKFKKENLLPFTQENLPKVFEIYPEILNESIHNNSYLKSKEFDSFINGLKLNFNSFNIDFYLKTILINQFQFGTVSDFVINQPQYKEKIIDLIYNNQLVEEILNNNPRERDKPIDWFINSFEELLSYPDPLKPKQFAIWKSIENEFKKEFLSYADISGYKLDIENSYHEACCKNQWYNKSSLAIDLLYKPLLWDKLDDQNPDESVFKLFFKLQQYICFWDKKLILKDHPSVDQWLNEKTVKQLIQETFPVQTGKSKPQLNQLAKELLEAAKKDSLVNDMLTKVAYLYFSKNPEQMQYYAYLNLPTRMERGAELCKNMDKPNSEPSIG